MRSNVQKIIVVFKTHFDFGFTALPHEVLESYARELIPHALRTWESTAHLGRKGAFVWTLPAWVLHRCLEMLDGTSEGRRLERAVELGGVVWHSLPFTTHTESLRPEVLVRGLWYGRELAERFGRRCISAKMTDVPGHTRFLPSLLASAGIRFLHLGSNSCSTPPEVPVLFRWEGPDGGGVVTMYSKGGYGSSLLPPDDWPCAVWLALQHTNDNTGPQDADSVREILDRIHLACPDAEVVTGGLDDFAAELIADEGALPVVRSDLADSWIHGLASMPAELATARAATRLLPAIEAADAAGLLPDGRTANGNETTAAIERAYAQLLLFGEHTFGLDTKIGLNTGEAGGRVYAKHAFADALSAGAYTRIVRSWEAKGTYARAAAEIAASLLPLPTTGAGETPRAGGTPMLLFNPHGWPFAGPVEIPPGLLVDTGGRTPLLRERKSGRVLPCYTACGRLYADVDHIPPLGALSIELAEAEREIGAEEVSVEELPVGGGEVVVENDYVSLAVDPTNGAVLRLMNRSTGKNWVDVEAGAAFASYRYDVYSRAEITSYLKAYAYDLTDWYLADFGKPGYPPGPHRRFDPPLVALSLRRGPLATSITCRYRPAVEGREEFGDAEEVVRTITLTGAHPWIDIDLRLTGKTATPFLESGHLVFPFAARQAAYSVAKSGGVIDPTRDIARDANRVLLCCDDWVDVADGKEGILLVPFASPLFSIGEVGIERFDGSYRPNRPIVSFNLFNNQWGTNFPQWIGGDLAFRFRLLPHTGGWQQASAWRLAADALRPPIAVLDRGAPRRFLAEGLDGLEVLSLRQAPDSPAAVVLRLREASGRAGERTLSFAEPGLRVSRLDLLERGPVEIPSEPYRGGTRVLLRFAPFAIQTLRFERRTDR